jgi:invasion protein IalB
MSARTPLAAVAMLMTAVAAAPAKAQNGGGGGNDGSSSDKTFQDWGKACEDVPQRDEDVCYIAQTAQFADSDMSVEVSVGRLIVDHDGIVAAIWVPTGVDLGAGLALRVDDTEQITADYDVCLKQGCQAFIDLQEREQLSKMRRGKVLHIGFVPFGTKGTRVVRVSLDGFTAGLDALVE